MKLSCKTVFLTFLPFLLISPAYSQEGETKANVLNFYLDCFHCDFDFVRQELPFISFVRDPLLADVHILVSESNTGSGGEKFFLNFLGRNDLKGVDYEYNVTTNQSDTDDDVRKALLKILKIGILQYYSKAGIIDQMNVEIEDKGNRKADELTIDRWNKWVFTVMAGGELQKEESQTAYSLNLGTSAGKITEEWKTMFSGFYGFDHEKKDIYKDTIVVIKDTTIFNKQNNKEFSGYFVKSLNEKWSAGLFAEYSSRNYVNIEHKTELAGGIEYNFFPWSECNRRVFAIQYWAGINYVDYYELTIYDKMYETLFSEGLEIKLELIQPWGEISVGIEGRHYFHDFSKNRLTLESEFSIRLSKNLSIFCDIQSEIIHDQLYLPADNASRDDILMERRKLATTFEVRSELGLRFTFGSRYNNAVNERF